VRPHGEDAHRCKEALHAQELNLLVLIATGLGLRPGGV